MNNQYDVIIIGAGAAGLMAAAQSGYRGRKTIVIDHASKIGEKIRISGGGRCNFTNMFARPETFLSGNEHFCKSALKQYTQDDFIELVKRHNIAFHEKKLGQLFCDVSAKQIIDMLVTECADAGATISMETAITHISYENDLYHIKANDNDYSCESLVIATGGLSIPKIGATGFGYDIARQFGLTVTPLVPGLVPLTFSDEVLELCKGLSGVSVEASVTHNKTNFAEGLLFTHKGLSGPSILQISSYWGEDEEIIINLAPDMDVLTMLKDARNTMPKADIQKILGGAVPSRLATAICERENMTGRIADLSNAKLEILAAAVNEWRVIPSGTQGYKIAEVTLGGVDTDQLSSKTMECKKQPGLYFIGEVVDVTGHLGGYNFQWAWSSGYVAGQNV
jgi:predicted Rossmann fold flavoprotein